MIGKAKAFLQLFEQYKRVNDPAKWKKGQVTVDALSGFFMAAASVYVYSSGTDIVIADQTIDSISAAVIAAVPAIISLWSGVSTVITTNKIGIKPKVQAVERSGE